MTLADADGGATRLDYDADAVVGGVIGGVGQRMLAGVAKKTAGEFFAAVDDVLTGRERRVPSEPSVAAGTAAPAVFTAPSRQRAPMSVADMSTAAVTGALIALAGVVLGWLITRRAQERPR